LQIYTDAFSEITTKKVMFTLRETNLKILTEFGGVGMNPI